jgi:hypothetical protein
MAKPPPIDSKIIRHEAGHALFAVGLGWTVAHCQVWPKPFVEVSQPDSFSASVYGKAIWEVVTATAEAIGGIDPDRLGKCLADPRALPLAVQAMCFLMAGDVLEQEKADAFLGVLCDPRGREPQADGNKIDLLDAAWNSSRAGPNLSGRMLRTVYHATRPLAHLAVHGLTTRLRGTNDITDQEAIRTAVIGNGSEFNAFKATLAGVVASLVTSIGDSAPGKSLLVVLVEWHRG